jgi:hypothetical protein
MPDRTQSETREPHLTGAAPPLLPDLAALMSAAQSLMDQLKGTVT